jgi:hypothetical protein
MHTNARTRIAVALLEAGASGQVVLSASPVNNIETVYCILVEPGRVLLSVDNAFAGEAAWVELSALLIL